MTDAEHLEQAVLADPHDTVSYLVYADWLQSRGDQWGELIAVQVALETATGEARQRLSRREEELFSSMPGGRSVVASNLALVTWRRGFIDGALFDNQVDWMDESFDFEPIVRAVLQRREARALRALEVGLLRWGYQEQDGPRLLAMVSELGLASRLERLGLGEIDDDIDLDHHPLGDLSLVGRSFGHLRKLSLRGSRFSLGELPLPRLESLRIETCGLSLAALDAVIGRARPELRELTLWFGSEEYGSEAEASDLAPLLEHPERFPKLKRLGLMNAEFTGAICEPLAESPLLAQLESLDLSMGTLDEGQLGPLLDRAAAFSGLRHLDLSKNFLSKPAIAQLRAIYGDRVRWSDQKLDPQNPDLRYVSAHE